MENHEGQENSAFSICMQFLKQDQIKVQNNKPHRIPDIYLTLEETDIKNQVITKQNIMFRYKYNYIQLSKFCRSYMIMS